MVIYNRGRVRDIWLWKTFLVSILSFVTPPSCLSLLPSRVHPSTRCLYISIELILTTPCHQPGAMVCIPHYENDTRLHCAQLRDPANQRPPSQQNYWRCHRSATERDDQGAQEEHIRVKKQACRAYHSCNQFTRTNT